MINPFNGAFKKDGSAASEQGSQAAAAAQAAQARSNGVGHHYLRKEEREEGECTGESRAAPREEARG